MKGIQKLGTLLTLAVVAATLVLQAAIPLHAAEGMSLYKSCSRMKPFAHRAMVGATKNIERGWEDTVPAIKDTMSKGFHAELDVWHSTVDGTFVILHDRDITHTTHLMSGAPALPSKDVTKLSLAQVKSVRTNYYNYQVPTLDQAMNAAKNTSDTGKLRIEIKGSTSEWPDDVIQKYLDAIIAKDMLKRVQVFSSNLGVLKRFETINSDVVTVWKYNKSNVMNATNVDDMKKAGINSVAIEHWMVKDADMLTLKNAGITPAARLANDKAAFKAYASKAGGGYYKSIQTNYAGQYKKWCQAQK